MIQWMLLEGPGGDVPEKAVRRAWQGGRAVIAELSFPTRKSALQISVAWTEGARARRPARWPDVLAEWHEIYEDALFPDDACPILAEEASGLGADALVIHGEPGLTRSTVAWYAKGALASYEHVGSASVAWAPDQPLGRPFDGSLSSAAAWGGKKLASLLGSDRDTALFERMEKTAQAVGEALIKRALWRLLDRKPPTLDELAGQVANAPQRRLDV